MPSTEIKSTCFCTFAECAATAEPPRRDVKLVARATAETAVHWRTRRRFTSPVYGLQSNQGRHQNEQQANVSQTDEAGLRMSLRNAGSFASDTAASSTTSRPLASQLNDCRHVHMY